jgi:hypothetical protein
MLNLYMNVDWMVLYKLYVFCSGMKFQMAATAGLSLTLDPMGKMFQNASSLKPNCPGMIIGRSSVFYADRKSKMAATTGHSINTGPYRENRGSQEPVSFTWLQKKTIGPM